MIVCDASATVELLLDRSSIEPLSGLGAEEWHAPDLWGLEVLQALRGLLRGGKLSAPRAQQAFADLRLLTVLRHRHELLERRVWQLRDALSAYDAAYVALAEMLAAPLLTADARLARAATGLVDVIAR